MRSPQDEALSILGLARRAGALSVGVGAVRRALDAGAAEVVVTAGDASATQLKKLGRALDRVPTFRVAHAEELGAALGREPVSAVAVTDSALGARVRACRLEPVRADRVGPLRGL